MDTYPEEPNLIGVSKINILKEQYPAVFFHMVSPKRIAFLYGIAAAVLLLSFVLPELIPSLWALPYFGQILFWVLISEPLLVYWIRKFMTKFPIRRVIQFTEREIITVYPNGEKETVPYADFVRVEDAGDYVLLYDKSGRTLISKAGFESGCWEGIQQRLRSQPQCRFKRRSSVFRQYLWVFPAVSLLIGIGLYFWNPTVDLPGTRKKDDPVYRIAQIYTETYQVEEGKACSSQFYKSADLALSVACDSSGHAPLVLYIGWKDGGKWNYDELYHLDHTSFEQDNISVTVFRGPGRNIVALDAGPDITVSECGENKLYHPYVLNSLRYINDGMLVLPEKAESFKILVNEEEKEILLDN